MIVLDNVLSLAEVDTICEALGQAEFEDGKLTASGAAALVKNNLQLKRPAGQPLPLDRSIVAALSRHELMKSYAIPKAFTLPIFAKYMPGMKYGAHVDSAIRGGNSILRSDLSITLFLSDPSAYEGGELVIEGETGPQAFKLSPGNAIVYPTFALHEVTEVTDGERLVAVNWCQSLVRDPQMRRVLFDLRAVTESLNESEPDSHEARLASKSLNNLIRLVVEV